MQSRSWSMGVNAVLICLILLASSFLSISNNSEFDISGDFPEETLATSISSGTRSADDFLGIWATKAPISIKRNGLGVAVVNDAIYAIGGAIIGGVQSIVEEYDPATDTWTIKTPMPTPRSHFGIGVVNDKIYVIGGNGGMNVTEEYDPVTDTWTTKAPLPTPRKSLGIGVVNGVIYAIGGVRRDVLFVYDNSTQEGNDTSTQGGISDITVEEIIFDTVEEYDPVTDTWTTKTPMPTPRKALAAGVVDGKVYAIGGKALPRINTTEMYDPEIDTWFTRTPMPTGRGEIAVGVVNGKIYAIGGTPEWTTNEEYNPFTDTWSTKTPMPTPRESFGIGVVDDVIYAIGGQDSSKKLNANEAFYSLDSKDTGFWATKSPMPTDRHGASSVAFNGKIYVFGGWELKTVEEYDPITDTWTTKSPMPNVHAYSGAVVIQDRIYVIGGNEKGGPIDVYDPFNDTWISKESMPFMRSWFCVAAINDLIYIIGGHYSPLHFDPHDNLTQSEWDNISYFYDNSHVLEYNPFNESWTKKAQIPHVNEYAGIAVIQNKIYFIGGAMGNYLQVYDSLTDNWTLKSPMLRNNYLFGTGVLDNKIHVMGGTIGSGETHDVYDPLTDQWSESIPLPTGRNTLAVAVIDNVIYAIGGRLGNHPGGVPVDDNEAYVLQSIQLDFDADGLSNLQEVENGTDPNNSDTDGDNLGDGFEVLFSKTDPNEWDTNGNGIGDGLEFLAEKGYIGSIKSLPDGWTSMTISWDDTDILVKTTSDLLDGDFVKVDEELRIVVSGSDGSTGNVILELPLEYCSSGPEILIAGAPVEYTTTKSNVCTIEIEYSHSIHELVARLKEGKEADILSDIGTLVLVGVVCSIVAILILFVVKNGVVKIQEGPEFSNEELKVMLEHMKTSGKISDEAYVDIKSFLEHDQ